ncbi:MAG TPA: LysM peptidoglycan-binding domain-containing protein, partial [Solirubrobacterales bacterium]|nr:LysM peptidoglycan-binding domain-containing protein [Solirubrobacterales bacterium]
MAAPILSTVVFATDEVLVRPGDTLTAISRRHDVSIERLVELNELANPHRIFVGQRLRLEPAPAATPAATPAAPAATASRVHTVRAGEHLTGIAKRYGVTIAAIASANRLADPSRIFAGQQLTIPGSGGAAKPAAPAPKPAAPAAAPAAPEATAARAHTVRAGEHLTGIAKRYGVSIASIVSANGLADPSRIFAGQQLTIPGGGATAPAASVPTMPESMAVLVAKRDAVRRVIVEEADRYGVPPALALAVAWQESGWQQGVVSSAGAVGVMQLLTATGEWVGEAMLDTAVNLSDLRHNVRAGVRLLAHYLDRYDGNRDLVLAAYYQGQTAADRHGVFAV